MNFHALLPPRNELFTTNLIYNETPYAYLTILPKNKKNHNIPYGVDGDILHVWLSSGVTFIYKPTVKQFKILFKI